MEEIKSLNYDVAGNIQDQKHAHEFTGNFQDQKQRHVVTDNFQDQKQRHVVTGNFQNQKQRHDVEWVTIEEYWKLTGHITSVRTIQRRIKMGYLPARKALKIHGQAGSGWEICIEDPKQIKAIKELRFLRSIWQPRLKDERKQARAERKKKKKEVEIGLNLPLQLYISLENLKIQDLVALQFSSYVKCLSEEKKQELTRSRKWHVRVDEVAHNEIKRLAKENGIPVHDVCLNLLQHYKDVLSQIQAEQNNKPEMIK